MFKVKINCAKLKLDWIGIHVPEKLGACMALTAFAKAMASTSQVLSSDLGVPVKLLGIGKQRFAHCSIAWSASQTRQWWILLYVTLVTSSYTCLCNSTLCNRCLSCCCALEKTWLKREEWLELEESRHEWRKFVPDPWFGQTVEETNARLQLLYWLKSGNFVRCTRSMLQHAPWAVWVTLNSAVARTPADYLRIQESHPRTQKSRVCRSLSYLLRRKGNH